MALGAYGRLWNETIHKEHISFRIEKKKKQTIKITGQSNICMAFSFSVMPFSIFFIILFLIFQMQPAHKVITQS